MKLWKITLKSRAHSCGQIEEALILAQSDSEAYSLLVDSQRRPWTRPDALPTGVYERDAYVIHEVLMTLPGVLLTQEGSC